MSRHALGLELHCERGADEDGRARAGRGRVPWHDVAEEAGEVVLGSVMGWVWQVKEGIGDVAGCVFFES